MILSHGSRVPLAIPGTADAVAIQDPMPRDRSHDPPGDSPEAGGATDGHFKKSLI